MKIGTVLYRSVLLITVLQIATKIISGASESITTSGVFLVVGVLFLFGGATQTELQKQNNARVACFERGYPEYAIIDNYVYCSNDMEVEKID